MNQNKNYLLDYKQSEHLQLYLNVKRLVHPVYFHVWLIMREGSGIT